MARQLDADSLQSLKQREGCKLDAYQDQGGVWTIGYGHTGPEVHEGQAITQQQADNLFTADLTEFCQCVETAVKVKLSDSQFGALVSFCYNIGMYAFEQSTLLKKLNAGDYSSVPSEMLKWVNVNHVRDEGLVNRRNSEGGQWVKGAYVRGAQVTPDKPPPFWRHPAVLKVGATVGTAVTSVGSHVTADSVQKATDIASNAAQRWHQFGIVAGALSALLVLWILFDVKKS